MFNLFKKKPVLVVMAAGIGSRFGGLKQAEPITEDGKGILDFTCYDAKKVGFKEVIFIIRKDIEKDFKELIGNRISKTMKVSYVFQDVSCLPEGRIKPFGTGHAILACENLIKGPFVVVNADDYYGSNAFKEIYKHLLKAKKGQYALVGYHLGNTLSKNGNVTRGLCTLENGVLKNIKEVHRIDPNRKCEIDGKETILGEDELVSMNLFGFTNDIFDILKEGYDKFLKKADLSKDEFLIPNIVGEALIEKKATVNVLDCKEKWYGITYREDLQEVKDALKKYISDGLYRNF